MSHKSDVAATWATGLRFAIPIGLVCTAVLGQTVVLGQAGPSPDSALLAPPLPWFEEWMRRTGEPVPDFGAMPSVADLPPLLRFDDGTKVRSPEDWARRKDEIRKLLCRYIIGTFPEKIPALVKSEARDESREHGVVRREVKLTFDTRPEATITIELMQPEGDGPFPVFMTQTTHRRVGLVGVSRGYLVCIYPGADSDDQTDAFRQAYPEADWGLIARRAWLAGRVLDYIQTLDAADMDKVAITGHSRNGKQSMIAAAFDERIKAVVSSSSGTGGAAPFRFVSEETYEESVEFMSRQEGTADWFHPRIRLFTGREDKLPTDIHALLALIAPRYCLLADGIYDGVATTFSVERNYVAGREVYRFLGRPEALRVHWRPTKHDWDTEIAQTYFDWFDRAFGRGNAEFPEQLMHDFDWNAWKAGQGSRSLELSSRLSADAGREERRRAVSWGLGRQPPSGVSRGGQYGQEREYMVVNLGRDWAGEDIKRIGLNFGDYVPGHFYCPKNATGPVPVVIWLHPYSYSKGYVGGYMIGPRIYQELARRGYGVFAFDMIGFGARLTESKRFYDRYPEWSRLGKMVADVRAAVDCLLDAEGRFKEPPHDSEKLNLPPIDKDHIYCVGYSLGGMVGLYATAMDDRIAGVASICGFTPMRTDTDARHTGGIRRFWQWHALQPRLGLFNGHERDIPYDFDDVLKLISPRPCLIVAPKHDRQADHADVVRCVESVRDAWPNASKLTFKTPDDYNRFQAEHHKPVIDWLNQQAGRTPPAEMMDRLEIP